jgi:hypothetical protein
VWEPADAQPLLVTGPRCRVLLTTRAPGVGKALTNPGRNVSVDVLSPGSAQELLFNLCPDLAEDSRAAALDLCRKLEYHPLALTLTGRLLDAESGVPDAMKKLLAILTEDAGARLSLKQDEHRSGVAGDGPVSLAQILGLSVDRLDPKLRYRFALSCFLGGDPVLWTLDEAEAVWQCSPREAELTTLAFVQRGLVERRGGDYWMHALLHDYAESLWRNEYDPSQ